MTTTSPQRTRRRLLVPAIMLGGGGAITGGCRRGCLGGGDRAGYLPALSEAWPARRRRADDA